MVARDHSCEAPFCIKTAVKACPKCTSWLCSRHLEHHSCEKIERWRTSSPALNVLKPDQVSVDEQSRKVTVRLDPARKKLSRKDWTGIIDR